MRFLGISQAQRIDETTKKNATSVSFVLAASAPDFTDKLRDFSVLRRYLSEQVRKLKQKQTGSDK
jgi:hypothetical protein